MDIRVNDRLEMKKPHPCGKNSKLFDVLRVGMDFRIRCCTCGHDIIVARSKAEKNIRKIIRPTESGDNNV